jgi:UDP-N-acetylmuramate dehydrogenase
LAALHTSWTSGFEKILRQGVDLGPYTWFRVGGPAEYLAEPNAFEELAALVRRAKDADIPIRILGGGSNLLVRSGGVVGLVIRLAGDVFSEIRVSGLTLEAGAGTRLGHLISTAVRDGLAGLETLVGIPGTIGGALRGNAGSRGGDIGQWTQGVTVMTAAGEIVHRTRNELVFAYRESSLDDLVILSAQFQLEQDKPEEVAKRMQKHWIMKKATQPLAYQSAGCIFKNPRGMSAGMIIEQAGLKGTRVGSASVSDRHANFIVAEPGASPDDILQLMDLIRDHVSQRMGIELESEIEVW